MKPSRGFRILGLVTVMMALWLLRVPDYFSRRLGIPAATMPLGLLLVDIALTVFAAAILYLLIAFIWALLKNEDE